MRRLSETRSRKVNLHSRERTGKLCYRRLPLLFLQLREISMETICVRRYACMRRCVMFTETPDGRAVSLYLRYNNVCTCSCRAQIIRINATKRDILSGALHVSCALFYALARENFARRRAPRDVPTRAHVYCRSREITQLIMCLLFLILISSDFLCFYSLTIALGLSQVYENFPPIFIILIHFFFIILIFSFSGDLCIDEVYTNISHTIY